MNRCDIAIRFCQGSFVQNYNREEFLDLLRDRMAELKVQATLIAKGTGKGSDQMEG